MSSSALLWSIQTGRVKPVALEAGDGACRQVMSGIGKTPMSTLASPQAVEVGRLGIAGDEQADLEVHGGLEKAVYAYPLAHYPHWQRFLGRKDVLPPGSLGENLLIDGLVEADLWLGDQLAIGRCVFSLTLPRRPCYKLNAVLGHHGAGREMLQHGLTGWYLRVDEVGRMAAGDAVTVLPGPRQVSLLERVRQMTRRADLA